MGRIERARINSAHEYLLFSLGHVIGEIVPRTIHPSRAFLVLGYLRRFARHERYVTHGCVQQISVILAELVRETLLFLY